MLLCLLVLDCLKLPAPPRSSLLLIAPAPTVTANLLFMVHHVGLNNQDHHQDHLAGHLERGDTFSVSCLNIDSLRRVNVTRDVMQALSVAPRPLRVKLPLCRSNTL